MRPRTLLTVLVLVGAAATLMSSPAMAKPSKTFSVSSGERAEADGVIPITVTRSVKSGFASVQISTSDGSATQPGDYTSVSQTVTFRGGRNTAVVNIPTSDDSVAEPDETFTVTLSSPSAGYGLSGSSAQGTIDNDDPAAAPTNVVATAVSSSEIDLTWDAPSDYAPQWDIYRSTVSGSEEYVTTVTTNSYNDSGLDPSTTYYYFVLANNGIGPANQSDEVSATTDDAP